MALKPPRIHYPPLLADTEDVLGMTAFELHALSHMTCQQTMPLGVHLFVLHYVLEMLEYVSYPGYHAAKIPRTWYDRDEAGATLSIALVRRCRSHLFVHDACNKNRLIYLRRLMYLYCEWIVLSALSVCVVSFLFSSLPHNPYAVFEFRIRKFRFRNAEPCKSLISAHLCRYGINRPGIPTRAAWQLWWRSYFYEIDRK